MNATEREHHEEARFLEEKGTPRSEQRRNAWGSLLMSPQTIPGLCPSIKCFRKAGHEGRCWPQ